MPFDAGVFASSGSLSLSKWLPEGPDPCYDLAMPKRSSRPPADPNRTAFDAVARPSAANGQEPEKNPAAVALGRLGGLKGGKARARKLSAETRSAIAKAAAEKRWKMESEKHR